MCSIDRTVHLMCIGLSLRWGISLRGLQIYYNILSFTLMHILLFNLQMKNSFPYILVVANIIQSGNSIQTLMRTKQISWVVLCFRYLAQFLL